MKGGVFKFFVDLPFDFSCCFKRAYELQLGVKLDSYFTSDLYSANISNAKCPVWNFNVSSLVVDR